MKNIYLALLTMMMNYAVIAQAVVYDNNGMGIDTSATAPKTLDIANFKVPANNNRLLVACAVNISNTPAPIVTFNGLTMTQAATLVTMRSGSRMTLYYLPLGSSASPITSTVSALGTAVRNLIAGSFHNVNQSTPVDGQDSISFTSNDPTGFTQMLSITSRSDDKVCDCIGAFAGSSGALMSYSSDSDQTVLGQNINTVRAGMSIKDGASTVPMSWTYNGNFSSTDCPDNTFRGSQVGINILSVSTVVPVELYHFEVQTTEDGKNQLTWATASETNNEGFDIEKSIDGVRFEKIGFVKGNGTTVEVKKYSFTDEKVTANLTYYRLRQVDTDGSFEYSKIISALRKSDKFNAISISPNPTSDVLNIVVETKNEDDLELNLLDVFGKVIKQQKTTVQQGLNNKSLDIQDLPNGIYFLQLQQGTEKIIRRIIKE